MYLKIHHEIIGTLLKIKSKNDHLELVITICKIIDIPYDAIPKEDLQAVVGKKVGLLNYNGSYKMRIIT